MTRTEKLIEKLRDVNYRKWVPLLLAQFLHMIVLMILVSATVMTFSLFGGNYESGKEQLILGELLLFYQSPSSSNYVLGFIFVIASIATWLFGTRVKWFTSTLFRRKASFLICAASVLVVICFYASKTILPIGYTLIMDIHDNFQSVYKDKLHRESIQIIATLVLTSPYFIAFSVVVKIAGLYRDDEVVQHWFKEYSFQHKWLGRFGDEKAGSLPDITLATRVETGVPAILTGDSRQLGVTLLGPPGSGKTSMKIIKAFRQDMGHMQRMINEFPRMAKKYGIDSLAYKRAIANYLIGSIIIEPAKDLCDSAYDVAIKHGLPEEFIVYLDPSNEETPGFNCMVGPLSQVAETITAVLDGMSEVSNEFFRQACRTVLKMYIYLIKIDRGNHCDLLDLDRMYQDPRFTMDLVLAVEKTIPADDVIHARVKDQRLYWTLVKRVIRWFKNDALSIQTDRDGLIVRYPKGHEHEGREKVMDLQSEFTRQTRNLLSDLIMNPYLARILINNSSADIDRIMEKGGILLCNTDNGLLGDVSDAFGKLVLMTVQNAVLRRKGDEKTRGLVSLYVDEFYDYVNRPYIKLASQGRKYKIAPFVAFQSLSQLAVKYDDKFVDVTLGTTRNLIVYGGVSTYDAKMLTKYLGSQSLDQLTVRENITPDGMESPNYSYSESVTREEVAIATEDDIMFNPFKFSYCRLVYEGSTKKAFLAEGDFIDRGEEDEWGKRIDPQALEQFMGYWSSRVESSSMDEIEPSEVVTVNDDVEEEIQGLTIQLEDEAKELRSRKESKRFDGFSQEERGQPLVKDSGIGFSVVQDRQQDNEHNQKVRNDFSEPVEPAEAVFSAAEESFSFSKNFGSLLQAKSEETPGKLFDTVDHHHGPKNKMNELKDVSVDEDEDAQAFVRALKARNESKRK